ncbi:glycosyltransferase family 8 protein [Flavobacteriaceae bacterium MHTCC 0001]
MKKYFAFCLNDKYFSFCYITIFSILENKKASDELAFHLLTDYLSKKDQKKFQDLVKQTNDSVNIHYVDKVKFEGFNMNFSIYVWFRILIPEILDKSISKVLYLDCDVIVKSNLDELFNLDIQNKALAAVIDKQSFTDQTFERLNYPKSKKYICAGVLLLNIDYWREHNITQKIYNFGKRYPEKSVFAEQDAINYICQDSKMMLPLKFGVINNFFSASYHYNEKEVLEAMNSPEIIHFAGNAPWKYISNHHFHKKIWWTYKRRANLGLNNINRNYIKSMLIYYLRVIKFFVLNFKPFPYRKPRTITNTQVLSSFKNRR